MQHMADSSFYQAKKESCQRIEMADSLITGTPLRIVHPFRTGAVLVKKQRGCSPFITSVHGKLYAGFNIPLMEILINPADVSPELTRHFRALRIWLPLQIHGSGTCHCLPWRKIICLQHISGTDYREIGFKNRTGTRFIDQLFLVPVWKSWWRYI